MAKTNYLSVDDYISLQPESVRKHLELVRATIRQALPEAEEVISYQIPAYRIHGRVALYFAGWKQHYSLYPVSEAQVTELSAEFHEDLATCEFSKGTVRFPLSRPVPVRLIESIATLLANAAAARAATKRLTRKYRG